MEAINTEFNTIDLVYANNPATTVAEYIAICQDLCEQADQFSDNENYMSARSVKEVYNSMAKVMSADCSYTAYVNARLVEVWLGKAWNNAE